MGHSNILLYFNNVLKVTILRSLKPQLSRLLILSPILKTGLTFLPNIKSIQAVKLCLCHAKKGNKNAEFPRKVSSARDESDQ